MSRKAALRRKVRQLHLVFGRFEKLKALDPRRIERLVFVCKGNVCRSPYAEALARSLGWRSASCGISVSRSVPAEPTAMEAAQIKGKDLSKHWSRSIVELTLGPSDCLVVMDPSNLPDARKAARRFESQLTLLGLWRDPPLCEIRDPYGKPLEEFHRCFGEIEEALQGLTTWIRDGK